MKVAYGYGRGSTQKQVKTLEAQEQDCQAAFAERYAREFTYGGFFKEPAEHGDTPFYQRPVAALLGKRLAGGDVVVVTSVDRPFRDFVDCVQVMIDWHRRGVVLYPIEIGVDTSSDASLMVVQIRASVAQFELSLVRRRTRRVLAQRKATHGFTNQHPGYGWKLAGPRGNRKRVPDEKEREQMAQIVKLHDEGGMSFEAIYLHFFRSGVRTTKGKVWNLNRVWAAYWAAKGRPGGPGVAKPAATKIDNQ